MKFFRNDNIKRVGYKFLNCIKFLVPIVILYFILFKVIDGDLGFYIGLIAGPIVGVIVGYFFSDGGCISIAENFNIRIESVIGIVAVVGYLIGKLIWGDFSLFIRFSAGIIAGIAVGSAVVRRMLYKPKPFKNFNFRIFIWIIIVMGILEVIGRLILKDIWYGGIEEMTIKFIVLVVIFKHFMIDKVSKIDEKK